MLRMPKKHSGHWKRSETSRNKCLWRQGSGMCRSTGWQIYLLAKPFPSRVLENSSLPLFIVYVIFWWENQKDNLPANVLNSKKGARMTSWYFESSALTPTETSGMMNNGDLSSTKSVGFAFSSFRTCNTSSFQVCRLFAFDPSIHSYLTASDCYK